MYICLLVICAINFFVSICSYFFIHLLQMLLHILCLFAYIHILSYQIHIHIRIHIYVYIYIYICVCVCVTCIVMYIYIYITYTYHIFHWMATPAMNRPVQKDRCLVALHGIQFRQQIGRRRKAQQLGDQQIPRRWQKKNAHGTTNGDLRRQLFFATPKKKHLKKKLWWVDHLGVKIEKDVAKNHGCHGK